MTLGGFKITHPCERELAMSLLKLSETIEKVSEEISLYKLCKVIYDVCRKLGKGYSTYKVINHPDMNTRLLYMRLPKDFWIYYFISLE